MHYMNANYMYGEKGCQQLHKNAASNIEQIQETAPNKTAAVRPPTDPSRKLSKLDEPDMRDTAGDVGMSS